MITSLSRAGQARLRTHRLSKKGARFLVYLVLLGGVCVMIYPLLWLISASFKPENLIFSSPGLISTQWTLGNYSDGWNALDYPFIQFFLNSLVICLGAIVGNILSCSLAAYAFARLQFKWKPFWFALMLGVILLPSHVLIVPQYILFKELGWIGTLLPLVAPKFFATDAFFIFLMIQFMRAIPTELDDAARIDGCNHFSFYWRVILPLSLPALVTTAIFTFIWTWSDFFSQLIYLNGDESIYSIAVALSHFIDSTSSSAYGQLFAMSVLSLIPIFGFFLIFQRLLIQGTNTTGLKG
jgi:multiple sugar transport system permease protein